MKDAHSGVHLYKLRRFSLGLGQNDTGNTFPQGWTALNFLCLTAFQSGPQHTPLQHSKSLAMEYSERKHFAQILMQHMHGSCQNS